MSTKFMELDSFQENRARVIIKDIQRGISFFDFNGNIWSYNFLTNTVYNQYDKTLNFEKFKELVCEYVAS